MRALSMADSSVMLCASLRLNLHLSVRAKKTMGGALTELAAELEVVRLPGSGTAIVYCWQRKEADEIARKLAQDGFHVRSYHADKTVEEKADILDGWQTGASSRTVVRATIAYARAHSLQ